MNEHSQFDINTFTYTVTFHTDDVFVRYSQIDRSKIKDDAFMADLRAEAAGVIAYSDKPATYERVWVSDED